MILEPVIPDDSQTEVLYELLKARKHTISHRNMPTYEDHASFVLNNPYRHWFLIYSEREIVGSVYVQYDNSVGISCFNPTTKNSLELLMSSLKAKVKPLEPVASVRLGDFFFNVPVSDTNYQNCLEDLGYVRSQVSFVSPEKAIDCEECM